MFSEEGIGKLILCAISSTVKWEPFRDQRWAKPIENFFKALLAPPKFQLTVKNPPIAPSVLPSPSHFVPAIIFLLFSQKFPPIPFQRQGQLSPRCLKRRPDNSPLSCNGNTCLKSMHHPRAAKTCFILAHSFHCLTGCKYFPKRSIADIHKNLLLMGKHAGRRTTFS